MSAERAGRAETHGRTLSSWKACAPKPWHDYARRDVASRCSSSRGRPARPDVSKASICAVPVGAHAADAAKLLREELPVHAEGVASQRPCGGNQGGTARDNCCFHRCASYLARYPAMSPSPSPERNHMLTTETSVRVASHAAAARHPLAAVPANFLEQWYHIGFFGITGEAASDHLT